MISPLFHLLTSFLLLNQFQFIQAEFVSLGLGVTYSRLASNLPPPNEALRLAQSQGFRRIRLYKPHEDALPAIQNSLDVILGVGNEDIVKIAFDKDFAKQWVDKNVKAYLESITFDMIAVGHDISPGDELAAALLPAMKALKHVLRSDGDDKLSLIPVVTPLKLSWLKSSHPPSTGEFDSAHLDIIQPIVEFMKRTTPYVLCDLYPYYALVNDPAYSNISISYALLSSPSVIVQDGDIGYTNLLDGLIDAFISALEKLGMTSIWMRVGATGWPVSSGVGGDLETIENAGTYITNVVARVLAAAKSPKSRMPPYIYLYNLFPQNQAVGIQRNFELFYTDKSPVFPNIRYNVTPHPIQL